MKSVREPTSYFRELVTQQVEHLPKAEPAWLPPARLRAIRHMQDAELPGPKQEGWRYTSLNPFLEHRFSPCTEDFTALQLEDIEDRLMAGHEDYYRVVLVNGRFAPQLSSLADVPGQVRVAGLRGAIHLNRDTSLQRLGSLGP